MGEDAADFGPAVGHGALGEVGRFRVREDLDGDEGGARPAHDVLEADEQFFQVIETAGVSITGVEGHAWDIHFVEAGDWCAVGGSVFGVFQDEMDEVAGSGLSDSGQAGEVGAEGGVAVECEDASVGLSQREAECDGGGPVHAVGKVDVQVAAVGDLMPVAEGDGGGYYQSVSAVVVDGAGDFAGWDHLLAESWLRLRRDSLRIWERREDTMR